MREDSKLATDGLSEKEILFQVWALLADRKPSKVAKIAKQDYGIEVNPKYISVYATRYHWHEKARALFNEVAPSMMERTAASLVSAGPEAAAYLYDVASGRVPPDRNRIVATVAVLDRVGFLPHTRRDAEQSAPHKLGTGTDLDSWQSLSDEELKAIIAGRYGD